MTYTGNVVVGGPSDLQRLAAVDIRKAAVGEWAANAYVLTCRRTGAQLLIDAGAEPDRLAAVLAEGGSGPLTAVVATHCHSDHVGALAAVVAATRAPTFAGADDADTITRETGVPVTWRLRTGDVVTAGDIRLEVIELRGHTPGAIALAYRDVTADSPQGRVHLFTGDSLFPGGVGNTDHDPARFAQLLGDVTKRIFDRFGDDTWVYPGHGADTTLGAERPHLGEWRARGW